MTINWWSIIGYFYNGILFDWWHKDMQSWPCVFSTLSAPSKKQQFRTFGLQGFKDLSSNHGKRVKAKPWIPMTWDVKDIFSLFPSCWMALVKSACGTGLKLNNFKMTPWQRKLPRSVLLRRFWRHGSTRNYFTAFEFGTWTVPVKPSSWPVRDQSSPRVECRNDVCLGSDSSTYHSSTKTWLVDLLPDPWSKIWSSCIIWLQL